MLSHHHYQTANRLLLLFYVGLCFWITNNHLDKVEETQKLHTQALTAIAESQKLLNEAIAMELLRRMAKRGP